MKKNKEDAFLDYMNIAKESWTWHRMTSDEQERCSEALRRTTLNGTYRQRMATLSDVHFSFLLGLDYKPIGWRETDKDVPLF